MQNHKQNGAKISILENWVQLSNNWILLQKHNKITVICPDNQNQIRMNIYHKFI